MLKVVENYPGTSIRISLLQRVCFCECWRNHLDTLLRTLLYDKSASTSDGINNLHNELMWAIENPHVVRKTHF